MIMTFCCQDTMDLGSDSSPGSSPEVPFDSERASCLIPILVASVVSTTLMSAFDKVPQFDDPKYGQGYVKDLLQGHDRTFKGHADE